MKRVEWWIAKVYPHSEVRKGESPIDLWEQFKSEREAKAYVKKDNKADGNSPFDVVKVTYETIR